MDMTLLQRTIKQFISSQHTDIDSVELLHLADIIASISKNSNEWNAAATLLAADHERNPGKRMAFRCYPTQELKSCINEVPRMSTLEWNTRALARIYGAEFEEVLNHQPREAHK